MFIVNINHKGSFYFIFGLLKKAFYLKTYSYEGYSNKYLFTQTSNGNTFFFNYFL